MSMHAETPRFAIYRAADSGGFEAGGPMRAGPITPAAAEGWTQLREAGYDRGHDTQLLFAAPGFSLTRVWFKSGLPLPRHSHDSGCLYYVLSGSLRIGRDTLSPGDGFFVGADVPYAYVPGEAGVEVLEFRASNDFDIRFLADNPGFWRKAAQQIADRQELWASEQRPAAAS